MKLQRTKMTFKEFEKTVHEFDSYLVEDFYNYVSDCINGQGKGNELFDDPVIFECCENARKTHRSQLKNRAGIYLFVMNCDYLFDEEQIENYKKTSGAKLNFKEKRELKKGSVFYVGSNNKSIYVRVGQHLNKTSETLSLASNYRHFMCERLTIIGLPVKEDVAELLNKNEMMKSFLLLNENSLHKYWKPHAGTAR